MEWGEGLDGTGALFEARDGRASLHASPSGALALYAAPGAWSTHAVAAALLAGAPPVLDPDALAQLFAFGYVADERSHIRGVRPVEPGTVVEFPGGMTSPDGRWSRVPEEDAYEAAESALLDSLARRVGDAAWLGLTAGADSRVIAVALRELGVPFRAFTWGAPGAAEVDGAAQVARALGVEHAALAGDWHEPEQARAMAERDARAHDGLGDFPLHGAPSWPAGIGAYVTGGGGETGRAFHYRLSAAGRPHPSRAQVERAWRPEDRIAAASPAAHAAVLRAKRHVLDCAAQAGHDGWSLLDVVYGDRRFPRWGRSMLPRESFPLIAGFSDPAVQRALASLPLADKISDGFHRRFVSSRHPELAPPSPRLPRRGVPRFARDLAAELLARRTRAAALRDAGRGGATGAYGSDGALLLRTWLADDALARPALVAAMGGAWAAQTRDGLLRGDPVAVEHALRAASLAALEDAMNRLTVR
jgi:hypothetical protein